MKKMLPNNTIKVMWITTVQLLFYITLLQLSSKRNILFVQGNNAIVKENEKPGISSHIWDVNGAGDQSIMGFSTDISKNLGETIGFKINSKETNNYRIDIFRLGYYQGHGARLIDTIYPFSFDNSSMDTTTKGDIQPECYKEEETYLIDCGNWDLSAEWKIPKENHGVISGLYIARPTRMDNEEEENNNNNNNNNDNNNNNNNNNRKHRNRKNWRSDNSKFLYDSKHFIDGEDPMQPPLSKPHSYGRTGFGELQNKILEPRASHIYFLVRDDNRNDSDFIFQTMDTTWQAYNGYGGYTTYGSYNYPYTHLPDEKLLNLSDPNHQSKRAYKASYNRPLITRDYRAVNAPLNSEYPMIRFLEKNGYDVNYISGVDIHRYGIDIIKNHKIYLSVGHDEYWSLPQRIAVTKARDYYGLNLAFFSGNEMFWKIRFEHSTFSSSSTFSTTDNNNNNNNNNNNEIISDDIENYRTMVCYKDTQAKFNLDPIEWTGTWRDPRNYYYDDNNTNKNSNNNDELMVTGSNPENSLTGQIFTVNAWRNDPLQIPARYVKNRLYRNITILQNLKRNEKFTSIKGVLGHEWDEPLDNGFRPEGLIKLSETTVNNVQYIQDFGTTYDSGTGTHSLTMYKTLIDPQAIVFGAGTPQWSWGLDNHHDSETGVPSERANKYSLRVNYDLNGPDAVIQQITVNLFADMLQKESPNTLDATLQKAYPSLDKDLPIIYSIDNSENDNNMFIFSEDLEYLIEISGTAYDLGGGIVSGVECSFTDDVWHQGEIIFNDHEIEKTKNHPYQRHQEDEEIHNSTTTDNNNQVIPSKWEFIWGNKESHFYYDPLNIDNFIKTNTENIEVKVRAIDDSGNIGDFEVIILQCIYL